MKRPVTLEDFYAGDGLARNSEVPARPQVRQPLRPLRPASMPRRPLLTEAEKQVLRDGLVAAQAARRLAEFAGVRVTPVKLAGVAIAALAAFGGYKWYKSRTGGRKKRRRIKNSLLGE